MHEVHDFELALVEPCMAILERGLPIDEQRRLQMIAALEAEIGPRTDDLQAVVVPLLSDQTPRFALFRCLKKKQEMLEALPPAVRDRAKKATKATLDRYLRRLGLGWRYNPDGDVQTQIVLYQLLKLPKRLRDKKLRVDEEALKDLRAYDKSGVVQHILAINKAATMVRILGRMAPGADGRLRTWLNPGGTETGRMSSSETFLEVSTNLQNLPKKAATVDPRYDVRDCVVPSPGHVLVEADLSQAEARVVAALCLDRQLLEAWKDPGFDVHRWTAGHIFSKSIDDVTAEERFLGKRARHALNYGMQWKTFLAQINADADQTGIALTAAQAKRIVTAYHRLHPSLERWWDRVERQLTETSTLTTVFGRRRTFFQRPGHERLKEAVAYEPQSTVADLLNRGMLRWWDHHDGRVGTLLLQVHDSVLIEAPTAKRGLAVRLLRHCLEEPLTINGVQLTLPVDVSTSTVSWARMEDA